MCMVAARRTGALVTVVLAVLLAVSPPAGATVSRVPPRPVTQSTAVTATTLPGPARPPQSWVVVDMDTGRVLQQHEAHVLRRPASTIKLLTVLTAQRHLAPDAMIPVSAYAAAMPALRIGLLAGQTWPLGQLITSTIAISANDAAVAIGEASGGTLDGFAAQMTEMGRTLGLVDAPQFTDPAGLDDNLFHGTGDWISAWDLALVGRAAMADPAIAEAAKNPIARFTDPLGHVRRLVNHNELIVRYPGATGLKTGFTNAAGHNLVATAKRDGRTIMVVAIDAPDIYGSVIDLLNLGFAIPAASETGVFLVPPPVTTTVAQPLPAATPASARSPLVLLAPVAGALGLGILLVLLGRRRSRRRRSVAREMAPRSPALHRGTLERRS